MVFPIATSLKWGARILVCQLSAFGPFPNQSKDNLHFLKPRLQLGTRPLEAHSDANFCPWHTLRSPSGWIRHLHKHWDGQQLLKKMHQTQREAREMEIPPLWSAVDWLQSPMTSLTCKSGWKLVSTTLAPGKSLKISPNSPWQNRKHYNHIKFQSSRAKAICKISVGDSSNQLMVQPYHYLYDQKQVHEPFQGFYNLIHSLQQ